MVMARRLVEDQLVLTGDLQPVLAAGMLDDHFIGAIEKDHARYDARQHLRVGGGLIPGISGSQPVVARCRPVRCVHGRTSP
jgi:hypothetical protein